MRTESLATLGLRLVLGLSFTLALSHATTAAAAVMPAETTVVETVSAEASLTVAVPS